MRKHKIFSRRPLYLTAAGHHLYAEAIEPENCKCTAQKPVLVFLHEGLGSIGQWKNFPDELCRETGCPGLVYDRWGYGKSDGLTNPLPLDYLREEASHSLPSVLKQCNISKLIFIGHSDGGSIALLYTALNPGKVLGIISEAAHVFVDDLTLEGIINTVEVYKKTDFKEKLARYHGANTDSMFYRWANTWLHPRYRDWNLRKHLPQITCPVLVLQGEDDRYGTPEQVHAIAGDVSGPSEKQFIPNCGHVPHHEARKVVLLKMKNFIRDILNNQ